MASVADCRPRVAIATLILAAISIGLMAALYAPGADSTRAYEGTDTRAFGLMFGAALAMVWPSQRLGATVSAQARRVLDISGVIALVVIALLIFTTDEYSPFIYRGGLVILSLATVVLIAALAHPASRLGPIIGWGPLKWIGVRSYGIYLWQLPIIALTTPALAKFDLTRATLQVGATIAIAALSWMPPPGALLPQLRSGLRTAGWNFSMHRLIWNWKPATLLLLKALRAMISVSYPSPVKQPGCK